MKILFTGGSSFTGYWFIQELVKMGHDVVATFTQTGPHAYQGIRGKRVESINQLCDTRFGCSFGGDQFLSLIRDCAHWDVLCHHAADATDYRSPSFDVARAVAHNTHRIDTVVQDLADRNCSRVLVTGSVFEPGEGAGSNELPAFSPYGVSKAAAWLYIRFCAEKHGIQADKFVIPNPFGPYEDARFCDYLIRKWFAGEIAEIRTPEYIRDNIHVSLLAKTYAQYVSILPSMRSASKLAPSGYIESQGRFAERFSSNLASRLGLECALSCLPQADFQEPLIRVNTDSARVLVNDWSEEATWDQLASYYQDLLS